jgi:hypothetical protein
VNLSLLPDWLKAEVFYFISFWADMVWVEFWKGRGVVLSGDDVLVNSEVWHGIVDWVGILPLWVEVLTALSAVADWVALKEILLIDLDISLPEWGEVLWSGGWGVLASWMSV